jgi:tetrahydromethanopterin S-methyltransferase subunit C
MIGRLFLIPVVGLALFAGLIAAQITCVVVPKVVGTVVPKVVQTVVPIVVRTVTRATDCKAD